MSKKYKVEIMVNGKLENFANLNIKRISILNEFLNDLDKAQKIENTEGKLFEGVYIFSPYVSKSELESAINELKKIALVIKNLEDLGIKKLAYKIPNKNDIKNPPAFEFGHYIIFDYLLTNEKLLEIENFSRLNTNIIKFINIEKN